MGSSATAFNDDSVQLLDLSLCAEQRSETLLGKLASTLFLAVLEQLEDSALIRGKAHNFADKSTDELDTGIKTLKIR